MIRFKTIFNEMAYPTSFSLKEFAALPSYAKRLRYADERLEKLGSGSSRIAYKVDDEKVLKIAKNQKGLAQNKYESDMGLQQYTIVAKVFDFDDEDNIWLEMQLARKMKLSDFQRIMGFSFKIFATYLKICESKQEPSRYRYNKPTLPKDMLDKLDDNEFVQDVYVLIREYGFSYGDFGRASTYGIVTDKHGKDKIVVIDAGGSEDVINTYY